MKILCISRSFSTGLKHILSVSVVECERCSHTHTDKHAHVSYVRGKKHISLCVAGFPVIFLDCRAGWSWGSRENKRGKTQSCTDLRILPYITLILRDGKAIPVCFISRDGRFFHRFEAVRCLITNQTLLRVAFLSVRRDEMPGKTSKISIFLQVLDT